MRRIPLLAAAFAISLAACQPSASGSPSGSAEESLGPSASETLPSEAPASDVATGPDLCAVEFTPCAIGAGTFSTSPFIHPFTFTITDDWSNNRAWPHGGEIQQGEASIDWVAGIESGTMPGGEEQQIGPAPADFIAYMTNYPGFSATVPAPVTIGGTEGQQFDVLTNDVEAPGIFFIPEDSFNLAPGEKVRYFVLEIDGETVVILVDAWVADQFDSFLEVAQPVIDSITWE
jgi:hypothetical protein